MPLEGLGKLKKSTSSGLDSTTFQLVALYLKKNYPTASPIFSITPEKYKAKSKNHRNLLLTYLSND
jgi:hypothetical protein